MKITTAIAALTAVSLIEFLSAYPVEVAAEKDLIQISNGEKSIQIPISDPTRTGNYLENLFYFLSPEKTEDAASVIAEDWNMHAERELAIAGETLPAKLGRPRLEDAGEIEFPAESREKSILEINEARPVADF